MPVILVKKIADGRGGGLTGAETESESVYLVQTNNAKDTEQTIFRSSMLPQYGFPHEDNPNIFARTFRAREHKGAFWWKATVGYDNKPLGSLPKFAQETQPIPWLRRVKVRGKSVHGKQPMLNAPLITIETAAAFYAGIDSHVLPSTLSALQGSSGEAFEGFEEDADYFVFEVTFNAERIPFWMADFNSAVNSAAVTILGQTMPKWSLKLRSFAFSDLIEEQLGPYLKYQYYQCSFELHYKRDRWVTGIPDRGFYKIVSGDKTEIMNPDGSKPMVPVNLNGLGGVLSGITASDVLYCWYGPKKEKAFSVLPALPG